MKVQLTERAREKGLVSVELLSQAETGNCIAGVLYEKRMKDGETIEWVDPIIIFKEPIKHGIYDKAVRIAEKAGILLLLPESKNFRTDYYGLMFNGYPTIIKSWGYTSNHVPVSKRWRKSVMEEKAVNWLPDVELMAEIIDFVITKMAEEITEDELVLMVSRLLKEKNVA